MEDFIQQRLLIDKEPLICKELIHQFSLSYEDVQRNLAACLQSEKLHLVTPVYLAQGISESGCTEVFLTKTKTSPSAIIYCLSPTSNFNPLQLSQQLSTLRFKPTIINSLCSIDLEVQKQKKLEELREHEKIAESIRGAAPQVAQPAAQEQAPAALQGPLKPAETSAKTTIEPKKPKQMTLGQFFKK